MDNTSTIDSSITRESTPSTDNTSTIDSIPPIDSTSTFDSTLPIDSTSTMDSTTPPRGAVQPKPDSGKKWLLIILFGLIFVFGLLITAYFFSHDEQRGITVIRMEGTMVTGQVSDADTIGSEVIGRELRNAADDPMVEAIVLRVNSPGGTPAAARKLSAISIMRNQKSRL